MRPSKQYAYVLLVRLLCMRSNFLDQTRSTRQGNRRDCPMAKRRRSYHDHADDEDIQIGMYRALRRIVEILEDGQRHQTARVVLTPRTVQTAEMPIPPPPAALPVPSFPPSPLTTQYEHRLQSMSQELLSIIHTMRQNDAGGNQPSL